MVLGSVFEAIDSGIGTPWIAAAAKIGAVTALLAFLSEFARWTAIRFWSVTSTRVERRAWITGPLKSARMLGADIRLPGWRDQLPKSALRLPKKNPAQIFHYVRARRLTNPISAREFERMAVRRSSIGIVTEYPMRITRAATRRPIILATASLIAHASERPGMLLVDLKKIYEKLPQIAEQRTWIPVLVVAIGIAAATRSSPLIDRVRARDEAAKDANRMLNELLAKLAELQTALSLCHEKLPTYRSSYFSHVCRSDQGGRTWSPRIGFQRDPLASPKPLEKELLDPEFQRAHSALEATHDHLKAIRDKGLSSVTFRMLAPVSTAVYDCGFHRHLYFLQGPTLETTSSPLSFDWMIRRAENVERHVTNEFNNEGACRADAILTEESYRLDDLILRSKMNELHLQRISIFLRKRIHGTTLTRLLGGAGAK